MKILYYYSRLNVGGAERSTVRLLNKFVEKGHDVTLLLRWNGGSLESELNPDIKVIYLKKSKNENGIFTNIIQSFLAYFRQKQLSKSCYNLAISGLFGYDPAILFKFVRAEKYCQMLRNDVAKTGAYGKTREYMQKYGSAFNAYIGVSEYVTQSFINCYPDLADKAFTIYNILPDFSPEIKPQRPKTLTADENVFKILTLCRMADEAKGLFRMERVCKRLAQKYSDFKWYVVGSGKDKSKLADIIRDDGLEDTMILCPETKTPQEYYYYVDLVAVLSYYEGLCGVVNEAKLMKKPLIATEFSGIHEQIENGVNGYIVDNDEESVFCAMDELLSDRNKVSKTAINGLPQNLADNDLKIEKYEQIYKIC